MMLVQDFVHDGELDYRNFFDLVADEIEDRVGIVAEIDILPERMIVSLQNSVRKSGSLWIDFTFSADKMKWDGKSIAAEVLFEVEYNQEIELQLSMGSADVEAIIASMRSEWEDVEIEYDGDDLPMAVVFLTGLNATFPTLPGNSRVDAVGEVYANKITKIYKDLYQGAFAIQDKLWQR